MICEARPTTRTPPDFTPGNLLAFPRWRKGTPQASDKDIRSQQRPLLSGGLAVAGDTARGLTWADLKRSRTAGFQPRPDLGYARRQLSGHAPEIKIMLIDDKRGG